MGQYNEFVFENIYKSWYLGRIIMVKVVSKLMVTYTEIRLEPVYWNSQKTNLHVHV